MTNEMTVANILKSKSYKALDWYKNGCRYKDEYHADMPDGTVDFNYGQISIKLDGEAICLVERFDRFVQRVQEWYRLIAFNAMCRDHYFLLNQLAEAAKEDLLAHSERSILLIKWIQSTFEKDEDTGDWWLTTNYNNIYEEGDDLAQCFDWIMKDADENKIFKEIKEFIVDQLTINSYKDII